MCNIYYYNEIKSRSDVSFENDFLKLISLEKNIKEITLIKVFENKRSSRELLKIIKESNSNDYMLFNSVKNLVLNDIDLKKALELLISKGNIGRPLIQYPDNWEENYVLWKNKKIPSKEFLNRVGLKKATFYNLLTEYRKSEK